MSRLSGMHLLLAAAAAAACAACASIGRPQGGPKDTEPPVFVHSNPAPGATGVKAQRIDLVFNENVQMDDPTNKVIVSPAQRLAPVISSNGRHVSVELRDTLQPDATYTIDFADAICDLNEKNILDGFALDFATGDVIDSLRISGMVMEAHTLEPAQGMLVGVYDAAAHGDTAISAVPFQRVARTNQLGQFTVRGLAPGTYRVYAVNDVNRDNHWDRSEDVAFLDYTVTPQVQAITVTDTLRSSLGEDSLRVRPGHSYLPNDVLLTWFNQEYRSQYLADYRRPERRKVTLTFGAPSDTMPQLTLIGGPRHGQLLDQMAVVSRTLHRDTLEYWMTDSAVYGRDSLLIQTRYLKTDTLDRLTWSTDTLKFNFKDSKSSKKKKKKDTDPEHPDTVPLQFLGISLSGAQMDLTADVTVRSDQPLLSVDPAGIHLDMLVDTLWTSQQTPPWVTDSLSPLIHRLHIPWQPGQKYRLTVDSTAITGIYGLWNRPLKAEYTAKQEEDYANIAFRVANVPDSAGPVMVELLSKQDQPVAARPVEADGRVVFTYVLPGTYYARAWLDADSSGTWTTGDVALHRQPEDVYYYPKKVVAKANWDLEQAWDLELMALDLQKPQEIKKNKPKRRAGDQSEKTDQEDDEEDMDNWDSNGFNGVNNNPYDRAGGRGNQNRNRPLGGGLQQVGQGQLRR